MSYKEIILFLMGTGFYTYVIFGQIENNHLAKGIRGHWSGRFATIGIVTMLIAVAWLVVRILIFLWSGV